MPRVTLGVQAELTLSGGPYAMELDLEVGQGPTQFVLGPQESQQPFSLADVVAGIGDMLQIPALKSVASLASDPPWSQIFAVQIAPYLTVRVGGTGGPSGAVQLLFKLYDEGTYGVTLGGTVGGVFTIAPSFTVYDLIVGYEQGKGLDVRARVHFDDQPAPKTLTAGDTPPAGKTQVVSYPFPLPPSGSKSFQVKYLGLGQRFGPPPYTGPGDPLASIFDQLEATFTSNDPATLLRKLPQYYDPSRGWFIGAHLLLRGWEIRALFNDPNIYGIEIACTVDQFAGLTFEILYQKLGPHLGVYYGSLTIPTKYRQINVGAVAITLPSFRIWIYTNGDFKVSVGWPLGPDSLSIQASIFTGGGGFYFAKLRSGDNPQGGQNQRLTAGNAVVAASGTAVQQYNPIIEFGLAVVLGVGRSFSQGPFSASLSLTLQGTFQGILAWDAPNDDPSQSSSIARTPDYFWFAATVSLVGQLQGSVDLVIIQISVMVRLSVTASVAFETGYGTVVGVEARVDVEASVHFLFFSVSVGFHATISQTFRVSSGQYGDASISGPQNPAFKGMNDWVATPALLERARETIPGVSFYPRPELAAVPAAVLASGPTAVGLHFVLQPSVTYSGGVGTVNGVATLTIPAPDPGNPNAPPTDLERLLTALAGWLLATYAPGTGQWADVATALGAGSAPAPAGFESGLDTFLAANVVFTLNGVDGTQPPPANPVSAALFPMFAELQMSWTGSDTPVPFSSHTTPADYPQVVSAYFADLSIQGLVSGSNGNGSAPMLRATANPAPGPSLAEFLFTDWFLMVSREVAKELAEGGGTSGMPNAAVATNVGGMVSRFMLNGLRLPDPATVPPVLNGLNLEALTIASGYALSGQQFAVPNPGAASCSATLSVASGAGPLATSIAFASGSSATSVMPLQAAPPEPAPVWQTPGLLQATQAQIQVAPLPAVQSQPLWFAQRTRLPWAQPGGATPFVVPLPPGVLQAAAGGAVTLGVADAQPTPSVPVPPAVPATPALTIALKVSRVPTPRTGGVAGSAPAPTTVPNVYQLLGTDDDTRTRIETLLAQPASALAGATLSVLYNAPSTGYQSDAPDATIPVLLAKTNLSTTTAPASVGNLFLFRAMAPSDPLGPTSAPLSDVTDFLRLLWEVSVVHSPGFYLQYADAQGNGLPDRVFAGDTADLTFLVSFGAASTAPVVSPWHNALTVAAALQGSLYMSVTDGSGNQMIAWSAAYPAGCLGFVIDWTEQNLRLTGAPLAAYDPDWAEHLYHLIQFQVNPVQGQFNPSLWSLALSPSTDSSGDAPGSAPAPTNGTQQNYRQLVPISAFAVTPGGQAATPYSAVGRTASLTFRVNDVFGNALTDATGTAPFPVLYSDPLLTPGEWPGVRSGYTFTATPSPALGVTLEFQPDFLAGGTSPPPATVSDNAGAALLRYRTILAQLQDSNTQLALSTSVLPSNGGVVGSGATLLPQLVAFVSGITTALQGIVASGSITGVQPITCALSAPVTPTDLANRTDDIFQVIVSLTLSRPVPLVDPVAVVNLPTIQSATQAIAAQLDQGGTSTVTLTAFATAFEATFQGFDGSDGTAKLAVRSDATTSGNAAPLDTLWAVRWSTSAGIRAAFTDPHAAYFTLAPLSTNLLNGSAPITTYDANLNPTQVTRTFTGVDLDAWAVSFLTALDGVLAPGMANALAQLDSASYHALMTSKSQLAAAVSGGVVPVFQPDPSLGAGDLKEAVDRFEQTLLASLSAAYSVSAVVQVPATVQVAGTAESGAQRPPRMFGSLAGVGGAPAGAYTVSTAKLMAAPTSVTPQYLTFVVSATSPDQETDLPMNLVYSIGFMEHRIDPADADFGYVPSEWLRFVQPGTTLALPLQPVDVPVPGRTVPPNPVLQLQTAAQHPAGGGGSGPLGGVLEWDYSVGIGLSDLEAHDDLWIEADYNLPITGQQPNSGTAPVPGPITGKLAPLFAALATFQGAWPVLGPFVNQLPAAARGTTPPGPSAETVIGALVQVVGAVASGWQALWAPTLAMDMMEAVLPQTDTFVLRFQELEQGTVEVFGLADLSGPSGLVWPTLNGAAPSVAPAPLPSGTMPPGPGQSWFVATYPFTATGSSTQLTVLFGAMDVLARQTGRTECWRVRNAALSSNPALVANPALVYQTPVVGFADPVVPLLIAPAVGPFPPIGPLSATLTPVLAQLASAGIATGDPRTLRVSVSYTFPLATAPDQTTLTSQIPVLLLDGIPLAADSAPQIAAQLAVAVNAWHGQINPVTPAGATLDLDCVVFASIDGARLPLVQLPDVSYSAPAGWWQPEG